MKTFCLVTCWATLVLAPLGKTPAVAGEGVDERFFTMTPEEVRKFEIEVLRKVADLALIPPVINTSPLPQYGYDKLDYGMTIGIERTPGAVSGRAGSREGTVRMPSSY